MERDGTNQRFPVGDKDQRPPLPAHLLVCLGEIDPNTLAWAPWSPPGRHHIWSQEPGLYSARQDSRGGTCTREKQKFSLYYRENTRLNIHLSLCTNLWNHFNYPILGAEIIKGTKASNFIVTQNLWPTRPGGYLCCELSHNTEWSTAEWKGP